MSIFSNNDVQMTYLSLKPANTGLAFFVDGKELPNSEIQQSIHSIVNFVSTLLHKPVVAKIEILDKNEYYSVSLNIPILPAYLDILDMSEVDFIQRDDFQKLAKKAAKTLTVGEIKKLVDQRTAQYINYIQHEFAAAYIKCMLSGQPDLAASIQKLPMLKSFDLAKFSFSKSGRVVYKTPQFLRFKTIQNETRQARDYYMGLQENIAESKRDASFYRTVTERDREYIRLDESFNHTISLLRQKYGEIDFMSPTASSNIEELPNKQ